VLINPWDQAPDETWRPWLTTHDFGHLAANGPAGGPPILVPTHFLLDRTSDGQDVVLLHLARPNPIWAAIAADPQVTLAVTDDYAFIPGPWRAPDPAEAPEEGVPTSYYASVHLLCRAEPVDDPAAKAALLDRQLARFEPEFPRPAITPGAPPYGRMLSAIRGLRLAVQDVRAKFKYDSHKPAELRAQVATGLRDRRRPIDAATLTHLAPEAGPSRGL
jgi:transcriptional regulator